MRNMGKCKKVGEKEREKRRLNEPENGQNIMIAIAFMCTYKYGQAQAHT